MPTAEKSLCMHEIPRPPTPPPQPNQGAPAKQAQKPDEGVITDVEIMELDITEDIPHGCTTRSDA